MPTRDELQAALESNLALQRVILLEWQRVQAALVARLKRRLSRRERAGREHHCHRATVVPIPTKSHVYRKWSRRFFLDHRDTTPSPNAHTLLRRQVESTTFFYHQHPPWSTKESQALESVVVQQQQQQQPDDDDDDDEEEASPSSPAPPALDWARIAQQLARRPLPRVETARPRSATECAIQYHLLHRQPAPITKEQALFMAEHLHAHHQQQQQDHAQPATADYEPPENSRPDWAWIAAQLTDSTPLEALVAYQTQIHPLANDPWTVTEDQVLFRWIAAAGPQQVLDAACLQHVHTSLFPHKTKKQVAFRLMNTLFNPSLQYDGAWTPREERQLVLLMKLYQGNLPRLMALMPRRSVHAVMLKWQRSLDPSYDAKPFTPQEDALLLQLLKPPSVAVAATAQSRGGEKVDEDDDADDDHDDHQPKDPSIPLPAASTTTAPLMVISWTELSQKYFPHRHSQRLQSRWAELATDQDLGARAVATWRTVRAPRSGPPAGQRRRAGVLPAQLIQPDAALTPQDFVMMPAVVRPQPKPTPRPRHKNHHHR